MPPTSDDPPAAGHDPSPEGPQHAPDGRVAATGERRDVYALIRRFAPLLVVVFCAGLLVIVGIIRPFGSPSSAPELRDPLVGAGTDPAAAYTVIHNAGGKDTLLGASSPAAASVELQAPSPEDAGVLVTVDELEIPGFEDTRLQPGSAQLLLTGLTAPLEVGDTIPITLEFERAGSLTMEAEVDTYESIARRLLPPRLQLPDETTATAP